MNFKVGKIFFISEISKTMSYVAPKIWNQGANCVFFRYCVAEMKRFWFVWWSQKIMCLEGFVTSSLIVEKNQV